MFIIELHKVLPFSLFVNMEDKAIFFEKKKLKWGLSMDIAFGAYAQCELHIAAVQLILGIQVWLCRKAD